MIGCKIKTICTVYAGLQKQQHSKLIKIPTGTIGVVRGKEIDWEFKIPYYVIRFTIDGKYYWARLAPTMFEEIISNEVLSSSI